MTNYYVALQAKSHAFLLEQRMKQKGIQCELAFLPREIMKDLCSMGVKFNESVLDIAVHVIKSCGLPGIRLYKAVMQSDGCKYSEVTL